MTKEELATEIATELGEDYSDSDVSSLFLDWVQDALEEIYLSGRWYQALQQPTYSTTNGGAVVTMSNNEAEILAVAIAGGTISGVKSLGKVSRHALIRYGKNPAEEGEPEYWYPGGSNSNGQLKLAFYPVPDGVYTVYTHSLKESPSPADTDELPLGPEFEAVLKDMVRYRSFRAENQLEQAQLAQQKYTEALSLLANRFSGPLRGGSRMPSVIGNVGIDPAPAGD